MAEETNERGPEETNERRPEGTDERRPEETDESESTRYRVHARIVRQPSDPEATERAEFVLLDLTPTEDPADAYEPVLVHAEGYDGEIAETVTALEPGNVVRATLDWTGKRATATFTDVTVERRTRYRFARDVEGLFEAARETWRDARAAGDAVNSRVTRDTDGQPNGALYVFADPAQRDVFESFQSGRRPIDPLVERVNEHHTAAADSAPTDEGTGVDGGSDSAADDLGSGSLAARLPTVEDTDDSDGQPNSSDADDSDGQPDSSDASESVDGEQPPEDAGTAAQSAPADSTPPAREVFVLSPADGAFVVVYVAFRRDGLLAETVRDTYDALGD